MSSAKRSRVTRKGSLLSNNQTAASTSDEVNQNEGNNSLTPSDEEGMTNEPDNSEIETSSTQAHLTEVLSLTPEGGSLILQNMSQSILSSSDSSFFNTMSAELEGMQDNLNFDID